MTLEYLEEQKLKYQQRQAYFKSIGFDILANDFKDVVTLIEDMVNHINNTHEIL